MYAEKSRFNTGPPPVSFRRCAGPVEIAGIAGGYRCSNSCVGPCISHARSCYLCVAVMLNLFLAWAYCARVCRVCDFGGCRRGACSCPGSEGCTTPCPPRRRSGRESSRSGGRTPRMQPRLRLARSSGATQPRYYFDEDPLFACSVVFLVLVRSARNPECLRTH